MNKTQKIYEVFKTVLDIEPNEIKPDEPLERSLGVDSTELVEISVGLKKALGIGLADNELKKTQSFNDIVKIIDSKINESLFEEFK